MNINPFKTNLIPEVSVNSVWIQIQPAWFELQYHHHSNHLKVIKVTFLNTFFSCFTQLFLKYTGLLLNGDDF